MPAATEDAEPVDAGPLAVPLVSVEEDGTAVADAVEETPWVVPELKVQKDVAPGVEEASAREVEEAAPEEGNDPEDHEAEVPPSASLGVGRQPASSITPTKTAASRRPRNGVVMLSPALCAEEGLPSIRRTGTRAASG